MDKIIPYHAYKGVQKRWFQGPRRIQSIEVKYLRRFDFGQLYALVKIDPEGLTQEKIESEIEDGISAVRKNVLDMAQSMAGSDIRDMVAPEDIKVYFYEKGGW